MFRFLKSERDVTPINDPKKVDSLYRYWRIQILIMMYIGYATFYLTRKSFNFAMPKILEEGLLTKADIGILTTIFYIIYGCSKFFSGIMSDNSNPRYFMGFGLFTTGIANILFASSSSFSLFVMLWALNAFFQGWGWPPCGKLLTHWYSKSERGTWWSIWNTSHNLGGAIVPILLGFFAMYYGWRVGIRVVGGIAVLNSLLLFWRLRDKPETMGLPSVATWRHDGEPADDKKEEQVNNQLMQESWLHTLKHYVLNNKWIWMLGLASVLVYIVRTGINDWGNLYLTQKYKYNLIEANSCVSFFEIGGFIGALIAGWTSDIFTKGNRGPINFMYAIGMIIVSIIMYLNLSGYYFYQAFCFFLIGFFVFGPQMLLGIAAVECSHRKVAGSSTGFIGLFGYIGAALAGYPFAKILDHYHWHGFFTVLIVSSILNACLLFPFLLKQPKI